jgi:hypothetical protein
MQRFFVDCYLKKDFPEKMDVAKKTLEGPYLRKGYAC